MQIKCIAIDDEPRALSVITELASKVPFLEMKGAFRSGIDALTYLSPTRIDLIFLDIHMPDLTGLQVLEALPYQPIIIFTTAYAEYALQSYDWNTADYLLKPIDQQRFLKAVNKAAGMLRAAATDNTAKAAQADDILIKSGVQTHRVLLNDILYVEASGNYVVVVTNNKRIVSLSSLTDIEARLPKANFVRVHRSFIIALKHLSLIENHQVKIGDHDVPVGRSYRDALKLISG
ncbi:LytR/AlgR family response regulator transcription factor [Mucilaginibacter myungsuensis]|uniref:Response regulator transcription factor n=1 Tax=Mucilaginibacter myungsuensis TaxID=649104 RepID=A0A929KZA8_9SPHI|nr:LytTR family DNA-binding domain-containing protein [Mucilaginibacter myungsuensis]MBE9664464.1 response regulator transcription factor [Mucilaginibacter myungsuensis]MDN3601391.1 LytTR family DNA-binding domain-containing protein [Mucilaginibacter myungsuensis]